MKKFEFTGETKTISLFFRTATLHRIRAVAEFGLVKIGDLGGWIEKEENLSHEGKAWVWGNAKVCGDAKVWGNAKVCGDAEVCGDAKVCGDAEVFSASHVLVIGAIGSRDDFTTFFRDKDNEITVKCGCFLGKIDKFLEKVTQTHKDSKYAFVYRAAVEVAKLQIDLSLEKPLVVGDKVKIISPEENDPGKNWSTEMSQYLGTIMTIKKVCKGGYYMEEDNEKWFWNNYRIEGKVE
uniref:Transferase, nesg, ydcK, Structural Genomics.38A n=1 Tax=Siphoviridae sp. ctnN38 TaxID=2826455 RepID=A0A8S5N619_9CAUD|nr:MAG TPA: Putative transferase, nesg, ydcK, Structural Genomics.38A [Siphoviridae sp. ctnN38]